MTIEAIGDRSIAGNRGSAFQVMPDLPPIGRLGMLVLAAGWGLLLIDPFVPGISDIRGGVLSVGRLGQSAILTGAVLAIVGLLMSIAGPRLGSISLGTARAFRPVADIGGFDNVVAPVVSLPIPHSAAKEEVQLSDQVGNLQTEHPGGSTVVVARGQVDERCFLVLADGTFVIETLLGQRRFRSLADARDFIGGGNFLLHDTVQIPIKAPALASDERPAKAAGESRVLRHV